MSEHTAELAEPHKPAIGDWLGTREFERVALALTRSAFLDGSTAIPRRKELWKEIAADLAALGIDPGDERDLERLDAEVELRKGAFRRMEYAEYLQTAHWHAVRAGARARAGHACQVCSNPNRLHVHHRTYDHLGFELPADVVVLCAICHQFFHDHRRLSR